MLDAAVTLACVVSIFFFKINRYHCNIDRNGTVCPDVLPSHLGSCSEAWT